MLVDETSSTTSELSDSHCPDYRRELLLIPTVLMEAHTVCNVEPFNKSLSAGSRLNVLKAINDYVVLIS